MEEYVDCWDANTSTKEPIRFISLLVGNGRRILSIEHEKQLRKRKKNEKYNFKGLRLFYFRLHFFKIVI